MRGEAHRGRAHHGSMGAKGERLATSRNTAVDHAQQVTGCGI